MPAWSKALNRVGELKEMVEGIIDAVGTVESVVDRVADAADEVIDLIDGDEDADNGKEDGEKGIGSWFRHDNVGKDTVAGSGSAAAAKRGVGDAPSASTADAAASLEAAEDALSEFEEAVAAVERAGSEASLGDAEGAAVHAAETLGDAGRAAADVARSMGDAARSVAAEMAAEASLADRVAEMADSVAADVAAGGSGAGLGGMGALDEAKRELLSELLEGSISGEDSSCNASSMFMKMIHNASLMDLLKENTSFEAMVGNSSFKDLCLTHLDDMTAASRGLTGDGEVEEDPMMQYAVLALKYIQVWGLAAAKASLVALVSVFTWLCRISLGFVVGVGLMLTLVAVATLFLNKTLTKMGMRPL